MDTLQEALFKAMLNNGWFTESNGDVESPQGYFGYVVNERKDFGEVYQAFEETILTYGAEHGFSKTRPEWVKQESWILEKFCGVWEAHINTLGIIHITKLGDYERRIGIGTLGLDPANEVYKKAESNHNRRCDEFEKWSES